jgi:hypothetical protein
VETFEFGAAAELALTVTDPITSAVIPITAVQLQVQSPADQALQNYSATIGPDGIARSDFTVGIAGVWRYLWSATANGLSAQKLGNFNVAVGARDFAYAPTVRGLRGVPGPAGIVGADAINAAPELTTGVAAAFLPATVGNTLYRVSGATLAALMGGSTGGGTPGASALLRQSGGYVLRQSGGRVLL